MLHVAGEGLWLDRQRDVKLDGRQRDHGMWLTPATVSWLVEAAECE